MARDSGSVITFTNSGTDSETASYYVGNVLRLFFSTSNNPVVTVVNNLVQRWIQVWCMPLKKTFLFLPGVAV